MYSFANTERGPILNGGFLLPQEGPWDLNSTEGFDPVSLGLRDLRVATGPGHVVLQQIALAVPLSATQYHLLWVTGMKTFGEPCSEGCKC